MTVAGQRSGATVEAPPAGPAATATFRLSIVMEWANTRLHGVWRAYQVFEEVDRQWRQVVDGDVPGDLPSEGRAFLASFDPRAELLVVSGEPVTEETRAWLGDRSHPGLDIRVLYAEGLGYYPLKNFGLARAAGDVVLFLDSDVLPDPGWLAHLLGSFGRDDVAAVAGQPYIEPTSLFSRAFALGWSYDRKRDGRGVAVREKFYGNNIAFRAEAVRAIGFPIMEGATRGSALLLRDALARRGIPIWQNLGAHVVHPPPQGLGHMVVRGLAHGRDTHLRRGGGRRWRGLVGTLTTAGHRCRRGWRACVREGGAVGLRAWQVPAAMAIIASYYACFVLGGLYTFLLPADARRRFQI